MLRILIVLFGAAALAAEPLVVSHVSYEDAVVLLADKAATQPQVEIMRLDGKRVKGRLLDANVDELVVERKAPIPLRAARSVRFPGLGMSRGRHGRGIALGTVAGLFVGGYLGFGVGSAGHESLGVGIYLTSPIVGGILGSKAAARGQDVLYVLRNGPGEPACGE
jgi:hypothetical protein